MPLDSKLRDQERRAVSASIRVVWQDKLGRDRYAVVHAFDISKKGMRIQLPEPVETRSILSLQCDGLKLHGSGSVRYYRREAGWYVAGVEFLAGLDWKP